MTPFQSIALAFTALIATAAALDEIDECPINCPYTYFPMCATDGLHYETFENECMLEVFNCKRQKSKFSPYTETDMDWCTTTELSEADKEFSADLQKMDSECIKPCQLIYRPICGSNGTHRRVFSNKCEMEMFDCLYKTSSQHWRILKEGKCSE